MVNIYCDESCHLQNDNSNIMLLGAIACNKSNVKAFSRDIRKIKRDFGLDESFEIKWTKVSPAKLDFYLALIDYFFSNDIQFRCVIAKGKKELNNEAYHQTYDDWYYKMYYLLLSKMLEPTKSYNVYIDIKDTNGGAKTRTLKTILNNFLYSFHTTCLKTLQIVKSDEVQLLQLCDLIIGCIGYQNRFITPLSQQHPVSVAKVRMCQRLEELAKCPLEQSTPLSEGKFNIFVWTPRN